MSDDTPRVPGRRLFLGAAAAGLAGAAFPARAEDFANSTEFEQAATPNTRANISSFVLRDWRDFFDNTKGGAILCDITSRALHYWSEDQSVYRLYPTSVPLTDELTKRGKATIVRKAENPPWRATPGELARNPDWPKVVPGGSPENPMGVRAMYLSWPTYAIHGTHDTRKIGRRSSNGCIGLYNEHIIELYGMAGIGTQVVLL